MMIAFGISSLFFAILGVFVPFFGVVLSGFSGFLAWMSTGKGTPLGAAAVIINLANIFFMSPGYILVVNMEAHLRNYDQQKIFLVWVIVLYFQISAVGVFIINYLLSLINFSAIFQSFKKKKGKKPYSNRIEQTTEDNSPAQRSMGLQPEITIDEESDVILLDDPIAFQTEKVKQQATEDNSPQQKSIGLQLETTIDEESDVILLDDPIIFKTDEDKKQHRIVSKNEYDENWGNLEEIPFDGSRPHAEGIKQNKVFLKAYSTVISCVLVAFVIVYLRPDLFPFLKYSNIYGAISRTFPEKHIFFFQKEKDQQPPSEKDEGALPHTQTPQKRAMEQPAPPSPNPRIHRNPPSDYWYIIELNSGENILTQDAVITRHYVSIILNNGKERRISKADLKSYVRKKI
jgi:hypothetical protein